MNRIKIALLVIIGFSLVGCGGSENSRSSCEQKVYDKYGERAGEIKDGVQKCMDGEKY